MKRIFTLSFLLISLTLFGQNYPSKINHVVWIGLDGFGAYAVEKAEMPVLKDLMKNGAYTLHRRTVLPSSSAVNWASMFMGAGPTMHGYTEWDSRVPEIPSVYTNPNGLFPSVFSVLKQQRPESTLAAVYSWGGIGYLLEKDLFDINEYTSDNEKLTVELSVKAIKEAKPNLIFIHFDEPDGVGHNIGHDTPEYYEELKNVDQRIAAIVQAVKDAVIADETLIVISSDHGGKGKGHGGKSITEVESPWVMYGPGVAKGKIVTEPTIIYDIASTITWAMGLEGHPVWRGKVIKGFFR